MKQIIFSDFLYISPSSPSGLRYTHDALSKNGLLLRPKGRIAGAPDGDGYWMVSVGGRAFRSHRIVFQLAHGFPPPCVIDHFDGNKSNNKIDNLRSVTKSINSRNAQRQDLNLANKTGIQLSTIKGLKYWTARWYTNEGKQAKKYFSIAKLGDAAAFNLACKHRDAVLLSLGGYTRRHGQASPAKGDGLDLEARHQQWAGVTDDQIDAEIDRHWGSVADYDEFRAFARSVIAADRAQRQDEMTT